MAIYYVQKVRRNPSFDGRHKHIIGVISSGAFYSNAEVRDSIQRGNAWFTEVIGVTNARITPASYCPQAACMYAPYLTTEADSTARNNLENLPEG